MLYLNINDKVTQKAVSVFYDPKKGLTLFKIYTKLRLIIREKKINSIEQLDKIVDWMIEQYRVHNLSLRECYKIIVQKQTHITKLVNIV